MTLDERVQSLADIEEHLRVNLSAFLTAILILSVYPGFY